MGVETQRRENMTAKLIAALNTIVENFDKVTDIQMYGEVYAFRYIRKHTWAIQPEWQHVYRGPRGLESLMGCDSRSDPRGEYGYRVFYFPGDVAPIEAAEAIALGHPLERISISSSEIKTTEAYETFSDLYRQLGMKYFNVENVLDEIIDTRQ